MSEVFTYVNAAAQNIAEQLNLKELNQDEYILLYETLVALYKQAYIDGRNFERENPIVV